MHVPDVNVLLNVALETSQHHLMAAGWLESVANGVEPIAVPLTVLVGFVRISTGTGVGVNRRTVTEALAFCEHLATMPAFVTLGEGPTHWQLFDETVRGSGVSGRDITDAHLATFALENNATFVTFDQGFRRFPGLKLLVLD